jgi:hypothetical protein
VIQGGDDEVMLTDGSRGNGGAVEDFLLATGCLAVIVGLGALVSGFLPWGVWARGRRH